MTRDEMLARLEKGDDPLDVSIDKWLDMVKKPTDNSGSQTCALCETYLFQGCLGCPANPTPKKTIEPDEDCCGGFWVVYYDGTNNCLPENELAKYARKVRDYLKSRKKKAVK